MKPFGWVRLVIWRLRQCCQIILLHRGERQQVAGVWGEFNELLVQGVLFPSDMQTLGPIGFQAFSASSRLIN